MTVSVADVSNAPPGSRGGEAPGCVVVGGGVAGVAAALAAADRGWRPLLLERGRVLGGMARSYATDGVAGDLDCGQHVVLACCTAYRALLRRLGTEALVPLAPRFDVRLVDERGRGGRLREAPLPAPLHLAAALARLPWLDASDRRAIAAACLRIRIRTTPEGVDAQSFAAWLGTAAATPRRRALWDLVCTATCNLPATDVSASMGMFVVREGLLRRRGAAALGVPRAGLSRLVEPVVAGLAAAGGGVRLGEAATRLLVDEHGVCGVATRGGTVPTRRVVVAGPPGLLAALAPEVAAHPSLRIAQRMDTSPIVNLHLRFDRRVLDEPVVAVWDSPLQWLFSRSRLHGEEGDEETVVCSLSAATGLVDLPGERVRDLLLPRLLAAQPRAGRARLVGWRVTRERHATVALRPGSAPYRIGPQTPVRGLALAGAWTATGWPVTMESAARSGAAAVQALARFVSSPAR